MALKRWANSVGLHVLGSEYSPVQQYFADCIAKHALLQPITFPPILTSKADGQHMLRSTWHSAIPHPIPPPTGFIDTGGFPPIPWQCSWPSQSPVSQDPFPFWSKWQFCLAHILPDHFSGTSMTISSALLSWKPPFFGVGWPALPRIPGHKISWQLFTSISWDPSARKQESYLVIGKQTRKREKKGYEKKRKRKRERNKAYLSEPGRLKCREERITDTRRLTLYNCYIIQDAKTEY